MSLSWLNKVLWDGVNCRRWGLVGKSRALLVCPWSSDITIALTPHIEYLSLKEMEPIQKTTTNLTVALWSTVPMDKSIATTKAQWTLWKRVEKDCSRKKIKEFPMRLRLLTMPEATLIMSHKHGCLNINWQTQHQKTC